MLRRTRKRVFFFVTLIGMKDNDVKFLQPGHRLTNSCIAGGVHQEVASLVHYWVVVTLCIGKKAIIVKDASGYGQSYCRSSKVNCMQVA